MDLHSHRGGKCPGFRSLKPLSSTLALLRPLPQPADNCLPLGLHRRKRPGETDANTESACRTCFSLSPSQLAFQFTGSSISLVTLNWWNQLWAGMKWRPRWREAQTADPRECSWSLPLAFGLYLPLVTPQCVFFFTLTFAWHSKSIDRK